MSGLPAVSRRFSLKNDLAELATLAAAIESFTAACQLPDEMTGALNLALEEVVTNVITYAYDDEGEHAIDVTMAYDGAAVTARIVDDGKPFDPLSMPEPDVTAPLEEREVGGLGIHLVRQVMTDTHYERQGPHNVLVLRKADIR